MIVLGLCNCQLAWQVACDLVCIRGLSPIKKGSANIISSIKSLRGICQASDLAAVTDLLFLHRHKKKLVAYWGPNQYGGIYEALAPVICLTLVAQLRMAAGLPMWANFADVEGGFDTIPKNDIRAGAFAAGVRGRSWMLMDDIFSRDLICISFLGFISKFVNMQAGIGQGRRRSLVDFNTASRPLHDTIIQHSPGVAAPSNMIPGILLRSANGITPPSSHAFSVERCRALLPMLLAAIFALQCRCYPRYALRLTAWHC